MKAAIQKILLSVFAAVVCTALAVSVSFAQSDMEAVEEGVGDQAIMESTVEDFGEDIDAIEDIDDYDLVYGAIKEVQADSIVVNQFDEATEEESDVTYAIDAETTLDGAENLTEFKAGDEVEVMFEDVEGKKVVRLLTKITDIYLDEEYSVPAEL